MPGSHLPPDRHQDRDVGRPRPEPIPKDPQIDHPRSEEVTATVKFLSSDAFAGIAVAAYNLGCFVGACTCIKLGDILGRRKTIFLGSSIMIVGAILQCSAHSLAHFIVGRLVTG